MNIMKSSDFLEALPGPPGQDGHPGPRPRPGPESMKTSLHTKNKIENFPKIPSSKIRNFESINQSIDSTISF